VAGLFILAACSTTQTPLDYHPAQRAAAAGTPLVRVGAYSDDRGVDAHFLGAVRGGFGQRLKTLETPAPMSDVIRKAFADGLAARGMLTDAASAPYTLSGSIEKFDCSQYVNREAHGIVRLTLTETGSSRVLMSQTFRVDVVADNGNLFDVGAFASTEDLRSVALKALAQLVDQSLDSNDMKQAAAPKS
jgi:hypothetical protein